MDETFEYINNRWVTPAKRANPEKFDGYDMVFFCNDHRHMNFTDKDFEDWTKTRDFMREKELIDRLRKR